MRTRTRTNYGQEIVQNEWQLGLGNFIRLALLSMFLGAILSVVYFSLFAPPGSIVIAAYYYWSLLYCKIPFGCSPSAINNINLLHPHMDKIGSTLNVCQYVFAFGTLISGVGLRAFFLRRGKQLTEEKYLRGAKLLKPEALQGEIDSRYPETPMDLKMGKEKIRFPETLAYRHLLLAGASGVGKTQGINSLLKQLEKQRRQKVLVLDLNGQYYSRFGKKNDIILSLYDKRTAAWDFWAEDAPPEFFAEALIELDNSNDKFFAPAGRALITDLLRRNIAVDGLWKDLTSSPEKLLPKLKGGISPALLGAPEQAAGVMATASLQLNFLQHLNHWSDGKPFTITDWCTSNSEDWIFLIVRDRDLAATKPLLRVWFDLATLGVLARNENEDYPHLWLIADELPALGQLPTLGKLLSQGRKYRASVVAGYQTSGQIEDLYGRDGAKEIFAGLQTKIFFRCSDSETSKKASLDLGEQDVEEIGTSIQFGKMPDSDRSTLNRSIKTRPIVMPSELQNLPDLQAYIKICDFNPTLLHFNYKNYPAVNESNCSEIPPTADLNKEPTKKTQSKTKNRSKPSSDSDYDFEPFDSEYDHNPDDENFLKF
ncbi:MAG: type IV secretion system DNA-binding domain-containing protein [Hydrococcus sp. Prado102]|nr:type IV secretion system DNA-binding domain-containing protein [Hydrococcus sp. Prado102]